MAIGIWAATAGAGVALGPVRRRVPARPLLVGIHLHRQRPRRRDRDRGCTTARPRVARRRVAPHRLARRRARRRSGSWPFGVGGDRSAERRVGDRRRCSRPSRSRSVLWARSSPGNDGSTGAVARRPAVPERELHRREHDDHAAVLRAVRLPVPLDPVPAVRARLLAVGRGRADAAVRGGDDRRGTALGEARDPVRRPARRDGGDGVLRRRAGSCCHHHDRERLRPPRHRHGLRWASGWVSPGPRRPSRS